MKWSFLWGLLNVEFSACAKIKYRSEEVAQRAIEKQAKLDRVRYKYFCKECKAWHLTKMEQ